MGGQAPTCFHWGLSRLSEVTIFVTVACMLNPVREGEEEAIRYRRRFKIFEDFLLSLLLYAFVQTDFIFFTVHQPRKNQPKRNQRKK